MSHCLGWLNDPVILSTFPKTPGLMSTRFGVQSIFMSSTGKGHSPELSLVLMGTLESYNARHGVTLLREHIVCVSSHCHLHEPALSSDRQIVMHRLATHSLLFAYHCLRCTLRTILYVGDSLFMRNAG